MAEDIWISLNLPVDEQAVIDAAIERLQTRWPDYMPEDGDMEVALLEIAGSWRSDMQRAITRVAAAALIAFGTKLYGVPFSSGTPSKVTVTVTAVDAAGYKLDAGAQLIIDDYAFNVDVDTVIAPGATVAAGVPMTCTLNTSASNGLTGATIAQSSMPSWVVDVTVDAPSASGTDPQTVLDYLNNFSNTLRQRAKTIVTTRDFEIEAVNFSSEIARATAVGDTARNVALYLEPATGFTVSTPTKDALLAHLSSPLFLLVNTVITINDPNYTTIDVAWTGEALPGIDPAGLEAAGDAALALFLSPLHYGSTLPVTQGQSGVSWGGDPKIRRNDLIALLKDVVGMKHVDDVTMSASGLSVDGNGDLTMSGVAPLPKPGTMTGTVT